MARGTRLPKWLSAATAATLGLLAACGRIPVDLGGDNTPDAMTADANDSGGPLLTLGKSDRHVFLDTDGDGILNDCPNPAHNVKGIAANTDNLAYCNGGSAGGKAIGTVSRAVSEATCTSGGGTVQPVRNA